MNNKHINLLIKEDVIALVRKLQYADLSKEAISMISGLLVTANHLMDSSSKMDMIVMDVNGDTIEHNNTSKRDLKKQWGGDLPPVKRTSKQSKSKIQPQNELVVGGDHPLTGHMGQECWYIDPKDVCNACKDRFDTPGSHPVVQGMPDDEDGNKPHMLCDRTIGYW